MKIDRITYKPGWRFEVTRVGDRASIRLYGDVIDSWHPHAPTMIDFETSVPYDASDEFYLDAAKQLVRRAEQHEINEWFKVDGKRWPTSRHGVF